MRRTSSPSQRNSKITTIAHSHSVIPQEPRKAIQIFAGLTHERWFFQIRFLFRQSVFYQISKCLGPSVSPLDRIQQFALPPFSLMNNFLRLPNGGSTEQRAEFNHLLFKLCWIRGFHQSIAVDSDEREPACPSLKVFGAAVPSLCTMNIPFSSFLYQLLVLYFA